MLKVIVVILAVQNLILWKRINRLEELTGMNSGAIYNIVRMLGKKEG